MNLFINYDSHVVNSLGEVETGDEVRLIDCQSCVDGNNPECTGADDGGFLPVLITSVCKSWRPIYELIY